MTAFLQSLLHGRPVRLTLLLSFIAVPAIIAISKLLGLVREALLTKILGLGAGLDLFVMFTTLPTYAMAYVMGPFAVAFYASLVRPGSSASGLARRLLPWLLGGAALGGLLAFGAALVIAPRMDMAGLSSVAYVAIAAACGATIPAAALIGLAVCLLHADKGHSTAVLLSAAQPWVFVLFLLTLDLAMTGNPFGPIGFSYAASFLLAVATAFWLTRRPRAIAADEAGRADLANFRGHLGWATLETSGFLANQLLTMAFAGLSGIGGIAANGLAARVMLTPLTLMVTPLSPILQNIYRRAAPPRRRRLFAVAYASFLACIALLMVLIVLFGEDVVRLFFQRGAFGAEDTARVAALLLPYGVYVVFIAANQLCAAVAFVNGDGRRYALTMLANYGAGSLLKIPMLAQFGLEGVIWAAAACEGSAALTNAWRQFASPSAARRQGIDP